MTEPRVVDLQEAAPEPADELLALPELHRRIRARRRSRLGALAAVAAAVVTAGTIVGVTQLRSQPTPDRPATAHPGPVTSHHREQRAIAYAGDLSSEPTLDGEQPLTDIPASLEHPDETIGANNLITRARYWSAPRSPLHVYRALKRASFVDLQVTGYGRPGAADNPDNYASVTYTPTGLPDYLEGATVFVEILGVSPHRSAVAAFAEVVPVPRRPANEVIPVGANVLLTRTQTEGGPPLRRVTLSPARAREFIRAFDAAPVRAGDCIGGIGPTFSYALAITLHGDRWRLGWQGVANCDALTVQLNGQPLPDIEGTSAVLRLLKTDVLGSDGFVDGGLYKVHGGLVGIPGVVTLSSHGHVIRRFSVGQRGAFEFIVPPGRYTLIGQPRTAAQNLACHAEGPAVVRAGGTVNDDVRCRAG